LTAGLLQETQHFTGLSVSPEGFLREHSPPVYFHLEHAARRLDQLDLRLRVRSADLDRQTGGPRLVVSDDAVFDRDAHGEEE